MAIHFRIDNLRENLNKLIEKTLRMEDLSPTDPRLQSQPMYENDVENLEEEIQQVSQQVPEKSQDSSNKIVNRHKNRYSQESNILQLELNLEIFCQISLTLELTKITFIMKILSWMSTCCLLKI